MGNLTAANISELKMVVQDLNRGHSDLYGTPNNFVNQPSVEQR